NDFTLSHWPAINEMGAVWEAEHVANKPLPEPEWDQVLPFLDVWLHVADNEVHYVQKILPTLDWDGGRLGVRMRLEPKDAAQLQQEYVTARSQALTLQAAGASLAAEQGKAAVEFQVAIWPQNLVEFLQRQLPAFFTVRAYVLDPAGCVDPEHGEAKPQALNGSEPIDGDPFRGLIRVDEISAQRGFGVAGEDNGEEAVTISGSRKLSAQLRQYYARHLDPYENPDAQDLLALKAIEEAQKAFNLRLSDGFKSPLKEMHRLGYPGVTDPKLNISTRLRPVDGLNHDAAVQFVVPMRGDAGAKIVDQAWRTAGVRELVSIPLYLIAVLSLPDGAPFPTTKEEVLRRFVAAHEKDARRAEALRAVARGFQQDFLDSLAVFATQTTNTAITDYSARRSLSETATLLVANGQIAAKPEPDAVLEVLVDNHVLMRAGDTPGVSFQHQQFQEWYASHWVERQIMANASVTAGLETLKAEIFNFPVWEEAILFTVERMARGEAPEKAACGAAILAAFEVDPLLVAEMIYRATDDVWTSIASTIQERVEHWHAPGKCDRALRFMMNSGRPEFLDRVWPLITHENDQVSLKALRNCRRFRPLLLGPDAVKRIKTLPPQPRLILLSEMASHSEMDGLDLATAIAKDDPDPEVQASVAEALAFRRADHHLAALLKEAKELTFDLLVRKDLIDDVSDERVRQGIAAARERQAKECVSAYDRLRAIVFASDGEDRSADLVAIISEMEVENSQDAVVHLVYEARNRYPRAVAEGLLARVRTGRTLFYGADDILASAGCSFEDDTLLQLALAEGPVRDDRAEAAASVLGPKATGRLVDALLDVATRSTAALMCEYLADPHFGELAASVLASQWETANEPPRDKGFFGGMDFSCVKEKRATRTADPTATSVESEAIFIAIGPLIADGATDEQKKLAASLGIVAARLPHGQRNTTIETLLALSSRRERSKLLLNRILSGEEIDSKLVVDGIAETFEAAKKEPWILTQSDGYELREWLRLLPFTNRPADTLEVVREMPAALRHPGFFEEMVGCLAETPSKEGEEILFKLAEDDPRFYQNYRWRETALKFGTTSAALRLIDLTANGTLHGKSFDHWRQVSELAALIAKFPEVRRHVYGLLKDEAMSQPLVLLARAVAESPDIEG
ncbi:hypothetical protein AA0K91_27925, partial [Burkholderia multivorans]|uniref:NACHT domain-containing protein n=1 Tax=Burkholderia multivorans TaxID=87883 RepID=UPI003F806719